MASARKGGDEGVKDRPRGGRRSNEPTSHGVVPTRAPSRFFLLLHRCLPRVLDALLSFSPASARRRSLALHNPLSHTRRPSRAYIIHISTLMFFDYVVRRSTFPLIFLRPLPYERGPQQAAVLREIVRRKAAPPTGIPRWPVSDRLRGSPVIRHT